MSMPHDDKMLIFALRDQNDWLTERNKELAAALEQFLDADVTGHLAPEGRESELHHARARARAALAKARP